MIEGIPNQSSLNTCPAQIKVIKDSGLTQHYYRPVFSNEQRKIENKW